MGLFGGSKATSSATSEAKDNRFAVAENATGIRFGDASGNGSKASTNIKSTTVIKQTDAKALATANAAIKAQQAIAAQAQETARRANEEMAKTSEQMAALGQATSAQVGATAAASINEMGSLARYGFAELGDTSRYTVAEMSDLSQGVLNNSRYAIDSNRDVLADSFGFGQMALLKSFEFAGDASDDALSAIMENGARTLEIVDGVVTSTQNSLQNAVDKVITADRSQDVETFQMIIKVVAFVAIAWAAVSAFKR